MNYFGGDEALILYAPETTTTLQGYGFTDTLPAIPSSPVTIGYVNVPQVTTRRNAKKGYGIGSPYALYDAKGTRIYAIDIDMRIASKEFLQKMLRGSGGYKNLADLAFYHGISDINGEGQTFVHRFVKCNNFQFSFQEGSAQELQATGSFLGLAEQNGSAMAPTEAQLKAPGAPFYWSNVLSVNIQGTQFRDRLMGISITGNHNLEPKGHRVDLGDNNPLSLTHIGLRPRTFEGRADITLHDRLDDALRKATVNASIWGDITINCSNADVQPTGETAKSMLVTLHDCILDEDAQQAKEVSEQMSHSASILYSRISID